MGCVLPAGQGQAPARQAALGAGFPLGPALTVNKVCGSGMRAVMIAANDLRCGDFEVVAAGGMESMSQAPYLLDGPARRLRLGHGKLIDSMIHDGLWDPYNDTAHGQLRRALRRGVQVHPRGAGRLRPRELPARAERHGDGAVRRGDRRRSRSRRRRATAGVDRDEEPFSVASREMPTLQPAFEKDGTVTAGNASKINDGAAAWC